ncbi:hypothetical protein [Streptomyces sp. CL7]|uniref:hypothetical protein n=1 Tax=Streptomyces sp. CL7 TaxID=3096006 RepID=UPI002A74FC9B|nr:hypothetical protein [Streptomyces sp. CL7]WPP28036.1 hypothetical protein SJH97_01375 [Streptomyces sp. CL7]
MSTPPTSDVDLFADDVVLDPYPVFTGLREQGPVVHLPRNDVYALTRYDVVRDSLADWESFSSASIAFNPMANEALTGTSLASDPPVHTQLRATLTENLSPGHCAASRGRSPRRPTPSSPISSRRARSRRSTRSPAPSRWRWSPT